MKHCHYSKIFKKILVTGGLGTVGGYVQKAFKNSEVCLMDKNDLDITQKRQVEKKIRKLKPDLIIHLAALTDVDFCEKEKSQAMKVNFQGTKNVASICQSVNIPLIYISTAAVFDGKSPPVGGYTEDDFPHPINTYARTKLLGEKVIQSMLNQFLIIRVGWLIGGGKKEKKFISFILGRIQKGETVKVVNDKFGTIAYAQDLLTFIKQRLVNSEFGLYHFGCLGVCSRFDIAQTIRDLLNKKAKIIPVSSKEFEKKFPAPRPQWEVLQSRKIPFQQPWEVVVKNYIKKELQ